MMPCSHAINKTLRFEATSTGLFVSGWPLWGNDGDGRGINVSEWWSVGYAFALAKILCDRKFQSRCSSLPYQSSQNVRFVPFLILWPVSWINEWMSLVSLFFHEQRMSVSCERSNERELWTIFLQCWLWRNLLRVLFGHASTTDEVRVFRWSELFCDMRTRQQQCWESDFLLLVWPKSRR